MVTRRRWSRFGASVLLRLTFVLILLSTVVVQADPRTETTIEKARPPALISSVVVRGGEELARRLARLEATGQPVLVHLWATWCPICRQRLRASVRAAESARRRGTQTLFVSLDDPAQGRAVDRLLRRAGYSGASIVLSDTDPSDVGAVLGIPDLDGSLPQTVLRKAGTVVRRWGSSSRDDDGTGFDPAAPRR